MATIVGTLIADHIHAIALGGDEWDINNLQTLCPECNKIKTAEDAGKIAKLREIDKKIVLKVVRRELEMFKEIDKLSQRKIEERREKISATIKM